jgi:PhnB protein
MPKTFIEPYLFFNGRCEEAIEFYRAAIGAEVLLQMRFKDNPDAATQPDMLPPGSENKIMHSTLRIGESTIHASDGQCQSGPSFEGFSISLSVPDGAAADRVFAALAEGGKVVMPLSKTFWSQKFGMLSDRFGVGWMITVGS